MHLEVDKNKIKSGLYIVATPIGNLSDITLRAIEILKKSNFILCEDIRLSKKLMNKYNINTELISNHKFNEKKNLLRVLNILKSNKISLNTAENELVNAPEIGTTCLRAIILMSNISLVYKVGNAYYDFSSDNEQKPILKNKLSVNKFLKKPEN